MSYEIPKAFTVVLLFHPLYIFVFLSNPGLGFYKGRVYLVNKLLRKGSSEFCSSLLHDLLCIWSCSYHGITQLIDNCAMTKSITYRIRVAYSYRDFWNLKIILPIF